MSLAAKFWSAGSINLSSLDIAPSLNRCADCAGCARRLPSPTIPSTDVPVCWRCRPVRHLPISSCTGCAGRADSFRRLLINGLPGVLGVQTTLQFPSIDVPMWRVCKTFLPLCAKSPCQLPPGPEMDRTPQRLPGQARSPADVARQTSLIGPSTLQLRPETRIRTSRNAFCASDQRINPTIENLQ